MSPYWACRPSEIVPDPQGEDDDLSMKINALGSGLDDHDIIVLFREGLAPNVGLLKREPDDEALRTMSVWKASAQLLEDLAEYCRQQWGVYRAERTEKKAQEIAAQGEKRWQARYRERLLREQTMKEQASKRRAATIRPDLPAERLSCSLLTPSSSPFWVTCPAGFIPVALAAFPQTVPWSWAGAGPLQTMRLSGRHPASITIGSRLAAMRSRESSSAFHSKSRGDTP